MRSVLALSTAAVAAAVPFAPVQVIPDSYIVKFKHGISSDAISQHQAWVANMHLPSEDPLELKKRDLGALVDGVRHTFEIGSHFLGYSGRFDSDVIDLIKKHSDVEYVEPDSLVHTWSPSEPASDKHKLETDECQHSTEKNSPWGLARISHRNSLSFGTFNQYLFSDEGGEGVDAYVIDTGCNIEHVDFEGRAFWGKTIPADDEDLDGNGHGTHCSGTIAGKKYGVAKNAKVYAVKVLKSNGSGTMSDVIKGVEWAVSRHLDQVKAAKDGKRRGFKGSVANMSLGGGKTVALDDVVDAAVANGVHFAVAAGNDNADSCRYSPAAAKNAVTVGASAFDDSRAYFSNWGKCTDIFAPGLDIQSTWIGSKHAVNTISGTSMASPHICGLLAYYLSLQPAIGSEFALEPITPARLKADVISIATSGVLSDLPEYTPNLLAWNGAGCRNYSSIVATSSYDATSTRTRESGRHATSDPQDAEELVIEMVSRRFDIPQLRRSALVISNGVRKAYHSAVTRFENALGGATVIVETEIVDTENMS